MSFPGLRPSQPRPGTIAAIDIGTNSVHMVVARVTGTGRFEVITRHKELVRLGQGPGEMKELTADAIDRGVVALERCRRIAESFDAQIVAVATSAVREADNRDEFISRALDEAGVVVDVISGYEEARLIHLGVLQALPVFDSVVLLCDIGGGSTELLYGLGQEILAARSLKLGAIRLTRRFFRGDSLEPGAVDACRRFVRDQVTPFVAETRSIRAESMVGSSGTIETLVSMARARAGESPRSFNAEVLGIDEVAECIDAVVAAGDVAAIRKLPGVDEGRADILLAGALILHEVMRLAGARSLVFSDAALREGVLLDALQRHSGVDHRELSDLRRHSVLHLMELCEEDPDHAVQVAWLSRRLFDGLESTLEVDPDAGELLEAAALLANVGLFISHSRHHQHSYYVIRNSEHMTGFSDREIEIIAQVARYHRKSAPSERHDPFRALSMEDRGLVRKLAAILRLAVGLDRSHAGAVASVTVDCSTGDEITLVAGAQPGVDLSLELYSAADRRQLLEEVTGRTVKVVAAAEAPV